jgi:hypothetical protein
MGSAIFLNQKLKKVIFRIHLYYTLLCAGKSQK